MVQVQKVYNKALEWYQSLACACAYLEKKYPNILTRYRQGEPGMPQAFAANMPPFRHRLAKGEVESIVALREEKKAPFTVIAQELRITPEKAKHAYDGYYHAQVLKIVKELEALAESEEQKRALRDAVFQSAGTPKKRYDLLMAWAGPAMEAPELFEKNGFFPAGTKK